MILQQLYDIFSKDTKEFSNCNEVQKPMKKINVILYQKSSLDETDIMILLDNIILIA